MARIVARIHRMASDAAIRLKTRARQRGSKRISTTGNELLIQSLLERGGGALFRFSGRLDPAGHSRHLGKGDD